MDRSNALGEFLRARRDGVTPQQLGIVAGGRRRVPGLRREELAMLAGISSDYYLRLEQGRDQHPSHQVVEALAAALQLDEPATAHLHGLAAPVSRRKAARRTAERVPIGIAQLIDDMPMPAYVVGNYFDILVANRMACGLSPGFTPGHNVLRQLFLDPADREFYVDWERVTAAIVGGLRSKTTADPDDPRLTELVGELSISSDRFRTLWARADVGHGRSGITHVRHPQVGELRLLHEKFDIGSVGGMQLVVHHAEPGTDSVQSLALLGTLTTSLDREESPAGEHATP
ncbi:helix-turn-helix transcriptional regulator [Nonomuraea sp. ZG12]|uniref:helix-turn-helix transcriptional regulator n=1 Tax=Nonomuraea sp. ZG12 TaxID=3452207 RepID=UPI003F8A22FD